MPFLLLFLLLIAATGVVLWSIRPHRWRLAGWLAALPPALVTLWLIAQLPAVSRGEVISETYSWIPALGLDFSLRLDGLALLFGLIIAGIGAAVALYTAYYFEADERQGYFYLLIFAFMASMLGLVWADNLLLLFVFWEGTSITSYLLIAFKTTSKEAKEGGRRAFLVTGSGGLAMLAGMVLLWMMTGTYSISGLLAQPGLTGQSLYPAALLLLLLGAFTKSAQFPFHFWLPGAMAAPTPASAYLHSATMVKAGVYLLARLHPGLAASPLWFWSLLIIGGITMLLGAVSALRYTDLKALLAYATVSQLGILVLLLAFEGEAASIAVAVGILAHALYKGPLFLVAGIVDHATGTRDLRRLGGLARLLPLVALTATLAGLSMAGLPPFFGFLSKELLLAAGETVAAKTGGLAGTPVLLASAAAGAFLAAASFTLLWEAFYRRAGAETAGVHHAPSIGFVLAPLALALIGTAIPFVLGAVEGVLFAPAAAAISGAPITAHLKLWHGVNLVLMVSLAAIGAGLLLFLARSTLRPLLRRWPERVTGVQLFNVLNDGTYALADRLTRSVQGTTLATQISIVLLAGAAALLFGSLGSLGDGSAVHWQLTGRLSWAESIIAVLAGVAAVVTALSPSRLSAIISLGVVGVAVTLFFIFFSAPDLALTQLLIEVLTVVLLVLVFFRVRPDALPPLPPARLVRTFVVAGVMGLFGFGLVLLSNGIQAGESISRYYLTYSVPEGQGANVVNVILVDFRGYDTLGEITVLAIAAVGGVALLRSPRVRHLRERWGAGGPAETAPRPREGAARVPVEASDD